MRSSDLIQFLTLDVFHQDTAFQNHCRLLMLFTELCLPNVQLIRYFDILTNTCTRTHYVTVKAITPIKSQTRGYLLVYFITQLFMILGWRVWIRFYVYLLLFQNISFPTNQSVSLMPHFKGCHWPTFIEDSIKLKRESRRSRTVKQSELTFEERQVGLF